MLLGTRAGLPTDLDGRSSCPAQASISLTRVSLKSLCDIFFLTYKDRRMLLWERPGLTGGKRASLSTSMSNCWPCIYWPSCLPSQHSPRNEKMTSATQWNSLHCTEPKGSLLHSQVPAIVPILSQINLVHASPSHFLETSLVLSGHLLLFFQALWFPQVSPTKTLYAPLLFPIHATCFTHHLLDFITQIFGEYYIS